MSQGPNLGTECNALKDVKRRLKCADRVTPLEWPGHVTGDPGLVITQDGEMEFMWPFFVKASSTFFLVSLSPTFFGFLRSWNCDIYQITVLGKTHRKTDLLFCCFHGRLFDAKKTKNREVVQTHMGLVLEQLMDLMDLVDLVVMGPFLCGNHLGSRIVGWILGIACAFRSQWRCIISHLMIQICFIFPAYFVVIHHWHTKKRFNHHVNWLVVSNMFYFP